MICRQSIVPLTLWQHWDPQNKALCSLAVCPKTAHSNIPTPVPASAMRKEGICVSGKAIGKKEQIKPLLTRAKYRLSSVKGAVVKEAHFK